MARKPNKAALLRQLKAVDGNLSKLARRRRKSRYAVDLELAQAGIGPEVAERMRLKARVPGKRAHVDGVDVERGRLVAALARAGSYDAAATKLGMSRRTLFRRASEYSITAAEIAAARGI